MGHRRATSEGQRLLILATHGASLAAVAQAVGCRSRENCRCWLRGTKTPSARSRERLEVVFGIPQIAWVQRPYRRPLPTYPVHDAPRPVLATSTTLEACNALLRDIRTYRAQPGLRLQDQFRYADCEARILALRARLERDVELSEDRYVREHPAWRRLQERILGVLRPHPEVMQEMLAALERTDVSAKTDAPLRKPRSLRGFELYPQLDFEAEMFQLTRGWPRLASRHRIRAWRRQTRSRR